MNYLLQYIVFDKTGNKILEASAIPCTDESEMFELVDEMVGNYKYDPHFKDLNLFLSCGSKILFNSKED